MTEQKSEFKLAAGSVISAVVVGLLCVGGAAAAILEAGVVNKASWVYAVLGAMVAVASILRATGTADQYAAGRTTLKSKRLEIEREAARATSIRTRLGSVRVSREAGAPRDPQPPR